MRVHCGLPSRGTPAAFPAAFVHTPARAKSALPGSDRDSFSIAVKDVLPLHPAGNCPQLASPGYLGEEGMGDLGRKPGRSNDSSRFFKKPLLNVRHICMTYTDFVAICDTPER